MTTAELSKEFIQLWQTAEWDTFKNLLSEDVELKILGIDSILGRKDVFDIVKSGHGKSFNQETKVRNIIAEEKYVFLQLESIRNESFLGVPLSPKMEKALKADGGLSDQSICKTGIILEWNKKQLVNKITVIDTFVSTPNRAIDFFDVAF